MQFQCSTDRNIDYHYIDPANQPSNRSTDHLSRSSVLACSFQIKQTREEKTCFLPSKFTFLCSRNVHSIANVKQSRGKLQYKSKSIPKNINKCIIERHAIKTGNKKPSSRTSLSSEAHFLWPLLIVVHCSVPNAKQRCTCSSFCSR